ncbi:MAG: hypothetical protein WB755_02755 [Terriglobales bacterium]|jgi:hypothetical protein
MDQRPQFGGAAGEPVPTVDPEDVKPAWKLTLDVAKTHPGRQVGIGAEVFEHTCKPGADIPAVFYRASMITMLQRVAPAAVDPLLQDKPDAVFRAAAEIPMDWIGVGITSHGLPFDADEFIRRVREA